MIDEKFRIDISSDLDYENLIADIYFENQILAVLTQEEGLHNLRINIYPTKNKEFWDFRLDQFQNVIDRAKQRLTDLKKSDK